MIDRKIKVKWSEKGRTATGKALSGKPHVRFDERDVVVATT